MRKHIVANFHRFVALVCLAFVFAVGAGNLKSDPIKTADYNSLKHIGITYERPVWNLEQTINSVATRSSDHAPLYFILLNIWGHLTGRDLATLRVLSLLFALLSLAFTFRLALSTGGRTAGLNAVLLTASLAYFLYYSLEVRMYSLLVLCCACAAWAYWRVSISTATAGRRHWAALLLASAALINTHYFGFLVLAAIGIYHLLLAPKDGRWLKVCLVMMAAGLFFLPWLPVALRSFAQRSIPDQDVLSLLEALPAILSPYSNGLLLPWLLALVMLALGFRRLNEGERYIAVIAVALLGLILLANEFADLVIARRLRYTIVLLPAWNCALAIGLRLLPKWKLLRIPAFALWIGAGLMYMNSNDMLLYTNRLADGQINAPHYQHLIYEPTIAVRERDFVVSVHADTPLQHKQFDYYTGKRPLAFALIHMWINEAGELETQHNDKRFPDLESLADWDFPIWLVYNPSQTELAAMDVYANTLLEFFQHCKRYVDAPEAVVDMVLRKGVLCDLFVAEKPLEIIYDGGNHLENIAVEVTAEVLTASFVWARIAQNEYAFSIQIFDENGPTGMQIDDVIAGAPVHSYALDLRPLPAGDYVANLIVYGFESGRSQSGLIVNSQERFQREVEVARFSIVD
ncbi:MAG: glycosyltransferase family 39 protein [Chloroflexota bacterium]|nr:glycosyltransferase family 39 protein [Chloroflexota bacterium]MDE2948623.1 glycosyltransferase family 39 protein [Chloroflexota bacterium]